MVSHLFTFSRSNGHWRSGLLRALLLILGLAVYQLLASAMGGFSANYSWHLWPEGVLALYLYALCYALLNPSRVRSYLAAIPLLLLYLGSDIFYFAFGKVFRFVNIQELPELLVVLPWSYSVPLAMVLFVPFALLAWHFSWRVPRKAVVLLAPLLVTLLLLNSAPRAVAMAITDLGSVPVKYSDAKSVERNGRLTTMLYREAERLVALEELAPFRNRAKYDQQIQTKLQPVQQHLTGRNVHLIVLESFLDPRLFTRLKFSSSPVHPDFEALFGDQLGFSLSPVFGGATAQAEFEVLCGVPALERLSSVEFNVFNGSAAQCLPGELAKLGYFSSASNTYKPNFFNAAAAYQGAGFVASYFPREFTPAMESYLRFGDPGVEEYIFDRDLFDQNLGYVERRLQEHPEQPLFNYVLTIYGHTPHILDPEKRPERIKLISDYPDDHLSRSANQFYYRTEAIAHYVRELIRIDPDSLIILISDHVPPLRNGPNTYNALDYLGGMEKAFYYNRLAVIDRGKPQVLPLIHHYEMPSLVLNYLSDGAYCKRWGCSFTGNAKVAGEEELLDDYLLLMAHASE